jgi:hypothetical protein
MEISFIILFEESIIKARDVKLTLAVQPHSLRVQVRRKVEHKEKYCRKKMCYSKICLV